jgi:hypothetical protein
MEQGSITTLRCLIQAVKVQFDPEVINPASLIHIRLIVFFELSARMIRTIYY